VIVLVRCDDRLIHGQCMTVLVKGNQIERIIVVDNLTASNSILRSVFKAAVPADMRRASTRSTRLPPSSVRP